MTYFNFDVHDRINGRPTADWKRGSALTRFGGCDRSIRSDTEQSKGWIRTPSFLSLLALFLNFDTELYRQNRCVELCHGQPEMGCYSRLPIVREPLLGQHRNQIIDATTKDRQHG